MYKPRGYRAVTLAVGLGLSIVAWSPKTQAKNGKAGSVSGFYGSDATDVEIKPPQFHGIEPNLKLSYNSSGGNGLAGVGWDLSGYSSIERAGAGKGAPNYDSTDKFFLDGQELLPCTSLGGAAMRWYGFAHDWVNNLFGLDDTGPGGQLVAKNFGYWGNFWAHDVLNRATLVAVDMAMTKVLTIAGDRLETKMGHTETSILINGSLSQPLGLVTGYQDARDTAAAMGF